MGTPARSARPQDSEHCEQDTPASYESLSDLMTSSHPRGGSHHDSPISPLRRAFHWPQSPSLSSHAGSEADTSHHKRSFDPGEDDLSTLRLMALTVAIGGAQLAWTVEQAYGSPYLLSLRLSKEVTALVWLAGPLSGLVAQPIVGALSDLSRSRYRRRQYLVGSSVVTVTFLLCAAYATQIGGFLTGLLEGDDWDPSHADSTRIAALWIAVPSFAILDFGLNALQAACRALILDTAPPRQQNVANAWQGRMTHAANVLGFALGMADLAHSRLLRWVPGAQFARLSVLGCALLVTCVTVTCCCIPEAAPSRTRERGTPPSKVALLRVAVSSVTVALRSLPLAIQRICLVQFVSWLGWFSQLFFSTVFVGAVWHYQHPQAALDDDAGTRAGSRAMFVYAVVALATGALLPQLQAIGRWPSVLHARDRPTMALRRHVLRRLTDRNIWTASQLLLSVRGVRSIASDTCSALMMMSTLLVRTVGQATFVVGVIGISWSVSCWIPYAAMGEQVRILQAAAAQIDDGSPTRQATNDSLKSSQISRQSVQRALTECAPLLGPRRDSATQIATQRNASVEQPSEHLGGVLLGIHNLAIAIFRIAGASTGDDGSSTRPKLRWGPAGPVDSTAWVFAYGSIAAFAAAFAVRWIPAPDSESTYVVDLRYGVAPPPKEDENDVDEPPPPSPLRVRRGEPSRVFRGA